MIVLWVTALMTVIAASFAFATRSESVVASNLVARARAAALAESGVRRGMLALLVRDAKTRWRTDGTVYEAPMPGGDVRVALFAEDGKIDLNRAPDALIRSLIATLGKDADTGALAAAVLEWRHGSGTNGTSSRGRKGNTFLTAGGIARVPGFTYTLYRRLAGIITVYSHQPYLNPATASRSALLALPGVRLQQVEEFLALRDDPARTEQRLPLELLGDARRYLRRSTPNVFTIEAEATVPEGARASASAVVRLRGGAREPFQILTWSSEAAASLGAAPAAAVGER